MQPDLTSLLAQSAARHSHLCPRQVLGVRIGLAGLAAVGLAGPAVDKAALVIVETDGCFVDGVEAATGCSPGRRTLRIEDFLLKADFIIASFILLAFTGNRLPNQLHQNR